MATPLRYDYEALKAMPAREFAERDNAERNAHAAAEGWTFWTLIWMEDPDLDGNTAYDYLIPNAQQVLSDVYKEIHGYRPRGLYDMDAMTLEELDAEVVALYEAEDARLARVAAFEAEAAAKVAEATSGTPLTDNPFARLLGGQ